MFIHCLKCGKTFSVKKSRSATARYCSRACQKEGANIDCLQCGNNFYVKKCEKKKQFCSKKCFDDWQARNKLSLKCSLCNKKFQISRSLFTDSRGHQRQYCSRKCQLDDPALKLRLLEMNKQQQTLKITSIEKIGYSLLDVLGVQYSNQTLIAGKFCVDALCENLIVQFDGDYWHGNPMRFPQPSKLQSRRMKLDASQDAYLRKCGYKVLRLWEDDLRRRPDWCLDQIREYICLSRSSLLH